MRVFIDTSAFYAFFDRSDRFHVAAKNAWRDLLAEAGSRPITTSYVLVETVALLQRRLGFAAARDFLTELKPLALVRWVDEELHAAGEADFLRRAERRLSLVDCVSFACMKRDGIERAFTFDAHFRDAGFELVPDTAR